MNKQNKQPKTGNKVVSCSLHFGRELTNNSSSQKKNQHVVKCSTGLQMWADSLEQLMQWRMTEDMELGMIWVAIGQVL